MAKIGITMGDCAGIGPEIILKALKSEDLKTGDEFIIYGEKKIFQQVSDMLNIFPGGIDHIKFVDLNVITRPLEFGIIDPEYGRAAGDYIKQAITDALEHKVDAITTGPIHKKSFQLGGYGEKYPGHTEMLASLTNTKDYTMMLAYKNLRVIHATIHVPLKKAVEMINRECVYRAISMGYKTCARMKIKNPRIAVAGLNPHAGDSGLFGDEEINEIEPAVKQAQQELDCLIDGPISPDTVFAKAYGGMYDMVIAMYHDQGHIPMKTLGFKYNHKEGNWDEVRGVNVTLGLPFIRSAVDHGTAFGKAGKGTASAESMVDAIQYALLFANE
jgi:4-phospho-D-threonate 3-dehydrogenase / 4-phospho-D-erythronate 3-dehydrogenase